MFYTDAYIYERWRIPSNRKVVQKKKKIYNENHCKTNSSIAIERTVISDEMFSRVIIMNRPYFQMFIRFVMEYDSVAFSMLLFCAKMLSDIHISIHVNT